jgi:peroxiredoxin
VEVVIDRQPPYRIAIRGLVEEALLHGPKLEIWTEISTIPGANTFRISDTITNRSGIEQEFGILYHGNYGPPLMEEGAKFVAPARQVTPMNEHAARDVSEYDVYQAPKAGFPEQVYCLSLWADESSRTKVMLRNAAGNKAVSIAYSIKELPFFTLWKNPVAPEDGYVTGLEPGTGFPQNRSIERKSGRVPKLGPHQSRSFTIDFGLHIGKKQVNTVIREIADIRADRETQVDKISLGASKVDINDIIKAAKTWRSSFQEWYGKPAPDFTLTDINGKKHSLSDYKDKNIMVVFWATWCGPCKLEIPHLIELRNTTSQNDLAILSISNENLNLVKGFANQAKLNYTVLIDRGGLPAPYNAIRAIPSAFFINRQGNFKLGTTGLVSLKEVKAILNAE